MSCTFWNMRRKLKAQQKADKVIVDIAAAQAQAKQEKKPTKKAGAKNDKSASTKS